MFGEHTPAGVWEAKGGMRLWLEKPAQISVQQSPMAMTCALQLQFLHLVLLESASVDSEGPLQDGLCFCCVSSV